MDIRQLRFFISVAKHLNFTAAAKEHHIDQTAMSKQIADLETQVGLKLFTRNTRQVQLTAAGTAFFKEANAIVAKTEEAIHKAHMASTGCVGSLCIGYLGWLERDGLSALIKKFRTIHPTVTLNLKRLNWGPVNEALEKGDIDIAFTFSFGLEELPGIVWEHSPAYPLSVPSCVVIPRDHPLADRETVNVSELSKEAFVTMSRSSYPLGFEHLNRICKAHGFNPNIVSQADLLENLLLLVETGIGITILSRLLERSASPNLRFIDIEDDTLYLHRVVAWKSANSNPVIPLFLDVQRKFNPMEAVQTKEVAER